MAKRNKTEKEKIGQTTDGSIIPDSEDTFDPEECFIPASGGDNDVSITQSFRCTSRMDRQMDIIIRSGKFGYVTKGDLLRHALYRYLAWALRLYPTIKSEMSAIDSIREICRHEAEMAKFAHTIEEVKETVNKLLSFSRQEKAKEMINRIYYKALQIEDPDWAKYFTETIEKSYGYMIEKQGVDLMDMIGGGNDTPA